MNFLSRSQEYRPFFFGEQTKDFGQRPMKMQFFKHLETHKKVEYGQCNTSDL